MTYFNPHLNDAIVVRNLFKAHVDAHEARGTDSIRADHDREGLANSEISLNLEHRVERAMRAGETDARTNLAAEIKAAAKASIDVNGWNVVDAHRIRWAKAAAAGW